MKLIEEVKDLAWRVRDIFTAEELLYLRGRALSSTVGDFFTEVGNNSVAQTRYRWLFVRDDADDDAQSQKIIKGVLQKVLRLLGHQDFHITEKYLKDRALVTRRFDENSFIDLHVERRLDYGLYHFVIFLSETRGGEVIFYSEEDALQDINKTPEKKALWAESMKNLGANELTFAEKTTTVKTEMNSMLIFKVGCPHSVNPLQQPATVDSRLTFNGWIDPEKHCAGGSYEKQS